MIVRLQDRNLIVSYLQIYLSEYFGMTLNKVDSTRRQVVKDTYEISQSTPIKINGVYTEEVYTSVGLFMAYNYPNEHYPVRWDLKDLSTNLWEQTPFESDKLITTMNLILRECLKSKSFPGTDMESLYNAAVSGHSDVLTYDVLLKYFEGESQGLYEKVYLKYFNKSDEYLPEDVNESLVLFLLNNLEQSKTNLEILNLDDRILSYVFEQVVTPISDMDEIFRVQKLIYPEGVSYNRAGVYDEKMLNDVKGVQRDFLSKYSSGDLPEGYMDFKVTGYVDPWTEVLFSRRGG